MRHRTQCVIASGPDRCSSHVEGPSTQACSNYELSLLVATRDRLSGTIAGHARFKGLWPLGQTIMCSLDYRRASEESQDQLVGVAERLVDSTEPRLLVDADGGFGKCDEKRPLGRNRDDRASLIQTGAPVRNWVVSGGGGRSLPKCGASTQYKSHPAFCSAAGPNRCSSLPTQAGDWGSRQPSARSNIYIRDPDPSVLGMRPGLVGAALTSRNALR